MVNDLLVCEVRPGRGKIVLMPRLAVASTWSLNRGFFLWTKMTLSGRSWTRRLRNRTSLIRREETYRDIGTIILKYREGKPEIMHAVIKGDIMLFP